MLTLRPADERGLTRLDWLDSRHSFSFADYVDRSQMGFGTLRVINDDRIAPAAGFGTHPHRDMEIITYMIDGTLAHRDSLGNGATIEAGEVQRMTAGTGIQHSEMNPSDETPARLLQIWVRPAETGLAPGYEQTRFDPDDRRGRLALLAAPDGRDGAVTIHQDVALYGAVLDPGDSVSHDLAPGRRAWLQVARGRATINGTAVAEGDGVAITDEQAIRLTGVDKADLLLFDLA